MQPATRSISAAASLVIEDEALKLRLSGFNYREIGEKLGVTFQAAHQRVKVALEKLATFSSEKAEQVRQLELDRLDLMLQRFMTIVEDKTQPLAAVAVASDRVLAIQKRRADLMGLDTVDKPLSGFVETDKDKLVDALRERIRKINVAFNAGVASEN